jgi:hypothetical protein
MPLGLSVLKRTEIPAKVVQIPEALLESSHPLINSDQDLLTVLLPPFIKTKFKNKKKSQVTNLWTEIFRDNRSKGALSPTEKYPKINCHQILECLCIILTSMDDYPNAKQCWLVARGIDRSSRLLCCDTKLPYNERCSCRRHSPAQI